MKLSLLCAFIILLTICTYIQIFGIEVGYGDIAYKQGDLIGDSMNCKVYWTFTDYHTIPSYDGYSCGIWLDEPYKTIWDYQHGLRR